ncbi:RNA polymerase sigma factor [Parvularcula dongshanensis]|uniref:RNA polymerase sigma-70 factor (ECF subfamily) n=1 Tax=Parvularcula dongshanensis TaxID=1173995 RepID=A0A840I481_9PROT|nr:sigma-70 family RNA polymerase sigma factor [Parvularcula dongshanensis]MBB4658840.1 RNA polymerase sigma-70 factor (ECF subfamily) [Parvularcula dongshanensis]
MTTGAITTTELNECLPALHRFAFTLTRNEDRANDLVQDCVERCLRKQHLFDGQNLRSWMFTVCRRVFLNQIRRDKVRGTPVDMDDAPQAKLSIDAAQEEKMHYQDVVEGFRDLPHNDKVVLSLVAIEGLKYEEAAELLDVPVGTVRSRLSRARSRLREALEQGAVQEERLSA